MNKGDIPYLTGRLTEIAEALGGKAPTPGAMPVWFDTLGECTLDDVKAVLSDWPKTHIKVPVPAEVLKLARARMSERLEKQGAQNTADARKPWAPERLRPANPGDPEYLKFKRWLAAFRARPARTDNQEWAKVLRVREEAGEVLMTAQRECWRAAVDYPINATLEQIMEIEGESQAST